MQESLPSENHAGDFYRRPTQFVPRNVSDIGIPNPFLMTSAVVEKAGSKRKHCHMADFKPSYVESCLVQLCRGKRWLDVIHRCRYFPEETCLVPLNNQNLGQHSVKHATSVQKSLPLFRETALGIICASNYLGTDTGKQAILALIHENPEQVVASQYNYGHTPLREAILNSCCTVEIFRILLEAASTCRGASHAFHQKDENGHTLMDHLITSVQLGSSPDSVSMLREFLRIKKTVSCLSENTSPLIRLLTMGNSFNVTASPMKARKFSTRGHKAKDLDKSKLRLQRILHVTKIFLDDDPGLLHKSSNVTKCTPLHIALRNYGNFIGLIQELLDRDLDKQMVRTRNCYGDLPIHVACSVGVPSDVLALMSEKTARVSATGNSPTGEEHPLSWSFNKSGYTPIDLEWISHVEAGHGLYTARPFSPSNTTTLKQHCFKKDAYYRDSLKNTVNEVIRCPNVANNKYDQDIRKREAETFFGCLLDRISVLIHASNFADQNKKASDEGHLGTPYSARLPFPLLELFLWLRPEQVMEEDPNGFLPIHHALSYGATVLGYENSSSNPLLLNTIDDWKSFVFLILDKSSKQCEVKSREGRLPLHYILEHSSTSSGEFSSPSNATTMEAKALQSSRHEIIEKLVKLYPKSVDQKDPVTGLYPFMMASSDRSMSIDTIFFLLRRSPSRCRSAGKANNI